MIIDEFKIYNYNIKVFYEATCDDLETIILALKDIYCPHKYILEAIDNLATCNLNSGLTYTNFNLKSSIIVITKTSSFAQLINTISHEYYHLISHISRNLNIEDEEELANLNGNLNMRSFKIIEKLL